MSIEAMKQALEFLDGLGRNHWGNRRAVMDALRAAIEQAEKYDQTSLELCKECGWKAVIPGEGCLVCARQKAKPVAWTSLTEIDWARREPGRAGSFWAIPNDPTKEIALYAAPRQWVGLTDEEVDEFYWISALTVEAIEAKLKEKNT
jgi:hypothetical protein